LTGLTYCKRIEIRSFLDDANRQILELDIKIDLEALRVINVYTEPSHTLICSILNRDLDLENSRWMPELSKQNLFFEKAGDCNILLPDPNFPETDFQLFLEGFLYPETAPVALEFARIDLDLSSEFRFGLNFGPDETGCLTYGQCGDGPEFWGPYCDPCIATLCCYGNWGYILCGLTLCE